MRRFALLAPAIVAVAVLAAACGSDDVSTSETEASEPIEETIDQTTGEIDVASPLVPVSGADICTNLTPEAVGAALGLTITGATPDDSATPQCAYEYSSGSGGTSNLTVASMRPDDVGGLAGGEAFDYVAEINRSIATGTDVDEVEPGVGEQSLRLTGEALHLGILAEGGSLFTVIVPVGDADGAQVDALLVAMAQSLA